MVLKVDMEEVRRYETMEGSDEHPAAVREGGRDGAANHKPSQWYLMVASCMAAIGGMLFGYDIGIISGAMLQLKDYLSLTCLQQETVVSSLLAGAVVGSIVGGPLVDWAGRKLSIVVNSVVFVLGAILLGAARSYETVIAGRVIVGFAVALSAIAECVYISEIAPAKRRGSLVSLNELGICIGILLAYIVNYLFITVRDGWRYMLSLSAVLAAIQGVGMLFLPRSPRFLLLKGNDLKAEEVLCKLRGTSAQQELQQMRNAVAEERNHSCFHLCLPKDNMLFRLLIGIGLVTTQQLSGQPSVLYYAPTVFQAVGFHSDTSATLATVGVGMVKLVCLIITLVCVDRLGRRKFLLVSTALMACAVLTLALVVRAAHRDHLVTPCSDGGGTGWSNVTATNVTTALTTSAAPSGLLMSDVEKWLALLSILVYVGAYEIGFGPISWLVVTEIFPSALRGRALAAVIVFNWLANLLVAYTFLETMQAVGVSGTFGLYCLVCVVGFVFIFLLVPETRAKPLEQINRDLSSTSVGQRVKLRLKQLAVCCGKSVPESDVSVQYRPFPDETEEELQSEELRIDPSLSSGLISNGF